MLPIQHDYRFYLSEWKTIKIKDLVWAQDNKSLDTYVVVSYYLTPIDVSSSFFLSFSAKLFVWAKK